MPKTSPADTGPAPSAAPGPRGRDKDAARQARVPVPLTTVPQPMDGLARAAADMLLSPEARDRHGSSRPESVIRASTSEPSR